MDYNRHLIAIRKLSANLTRVLRAVRDVLLRSGLPETSLYDGVWEQYKVICQLDGKRLRKFSLYYSSHCESDETYLRFVGVTRSSMLQVCHSIRQLVGDGLLKTDDERVTYCTKFALNTEPDMIKLALNDKK